MIFYLSKNMTLYDNNICFVIFKYVTKYEIFNEEVNLNFCDRNKSKFI